MGFDTATIGIGGKDVLTSEINGLSPDFNKRWGSNKPYIPVKMTIELRELGKIEATAKLTDEQFAKFQAMKLSNE